MDGTLFGGGLFVGGLFGGGIFVGGLLAGGLFPGRPFWSFPSINGKNRQITKVLEIYIQTKQLIPGQDRQHSMRLKSNYFRQFY